VDLHVLALVLVAAAAHAAWNAWLKDSDDRLSSMAAISLGWLIVWATPIAPIALVAAACETSILFAAVTSWGVP